MVDVEQRRTISRRTVTKAMAWGVPALALAAPVPAFAVSTPHNALGGVFYVTRLSSGTVTWDGRTSNGGQLFVSGTVHQQTITSMSLRFGSTKPVTGWTKSGGGNCWTLPAADGTLVYGGVSYYMYKSTYTCALPAAVDGDTPVDSNFYWSGTVSNPTQLITQRITRVSQPPGYAAPGTTITWIRNVANI
ncbi:hypothetical protein GCM10023171_21280 [Microbacterium panaciterrae]|uniref:Uncharacterized protein n=2 Tax=Microbacterium panaciterrae TaxID=985759 RepID=A0ABP8PGU5_9MICO